MKHLQIDYTNWRGERSQRKVVPTAIVWASNEWHKEPQWLMVAYDVEKKATRQFAMNCIHSMESASESTPWITSERLTEIAKKCATEKEEWPPTGRGPVPSEATWKALYDNLLKQHDAWASTANEARKQLEEIANRPPSVEYQRGFDDAVCQVVHSSARIDALYDLLEQHSKGPDGSFLAGDEIRVSLVTGILEIFSAQAKVDQ